VPDASTRDGGHRGLRRGLKLGAGLSGTWEPLSSPVGIRTAPGKGRDVTWQHAAPFADGVLCAEWRGADVSPQRFPGTPRLQEGHYHAALPPRYGGCPCRFPLRKKKEKKKIISKNYNVMDDLETLLEIVKLCFTLIKICS
jgi:hypothetical protein